jgi:hypothetical protein
MSGHALLRTMSALHTVRVPRTASTAFLSPYRSCTPASTAAPDTNATEVSTAAPGCAPNIGRIKTG